MQEGVGERGDWFFKITLSSTIEKDQKLLRFSKSKGTKWTLTKRQTDGGTDILGSQTDLMNLTKIFVKLLLQKSLSIRITAHTFFKNDLKIYSQDQTQMQWFLNWVSKLYKVWQGKYVHLIVAYNFMDNYKYLTEIKKNYLAAKTLK